MNVEVFGRVAVGPDFFFSLRISAALCLLKINRHGRDTHMGPNCPVLGTMPPFSRNVPPTLSQSPRSLLMDTQMRNTISYTHSKTPTHHSNLVILWFMFIQWDLNETIWTQCLFFFLSFNIFIVEYKWVFCVQKKKKLKGFMFTHTVL